MSTRYSVVPSLPSRMTKESVRELHYKKGQNVATDRIKINCIANGPDRKPYKSDLIATQAVERVEHRTEINRQIRWLNSDLKARDLMRTCEVTLRPEDSIERAARLMSESEDSAIPVVDNVGRLIGIITSRDITMRLIALGVSITHTQVSDCMTAEVFACSADHSLESCVSAMCWHQVKRIPLVDDEHKILGIITQRDLAEYLCQHSERIEPSQIVDILWALAS